MRIRKDIDFRWSVASASGSETFSLCVCGAPQFEAIPGESGVAIVWERGHSILWHLGCIVMLCHFWLLLSLERLCHHVVGNRPQVAKPDFFRTGKKIIILEEKAFWKVHT